MEGFKPGMQFGRYRLVAHLATGGMADIFLAAQTGVMGIEKPVVIKRILPSLSTNKRFINMLLDEATIAAKLNHRNIVQILDLGQVEGQYFIAMEHLEGEDLARIIPAGLQAQKKLSYEITAGIILQAAEGLQHAHGATGKDGRSLGVVHRDLSPHNIFVLHSGAVKLVDFGIALAADRITATRTGVLKGKTGYLSPEQITGREVDQRSDIFSLGIVMWECLTGKRLFKRAGQLKTLEAIATEDAVSPLICDSSIPEELAGIALQALSRERGARYQTAAELRSALANYLKKSGEVGDTAVIGRFMHDLFADKANEQRVMFERAWGRRHEEGFGEAEEAGGSDATKFSMRRRTTWQRLALLGVPLLLLGALVWLGFEWQVAPPGDLDGGVVSGVDSAVLSLRFGSDSGDEHQSNTVDAGLDSERDGRQKEQQVAPGDAGVVVPVADRAKERQRRRRSNRKKRFGRLRLKTTPWATIYHRGRRIGQTPLIDVKLPVGIVRLRARNEKAGIDKTITIRILPNKLVTKVHSFL